jgi:hypothetical protein
MLCYEEAKNAESLSKKVIFESKQEAEHLVYCRNQEMLCYEEAKNAETLSEKVIFG